MLSTPVLTAIKKNDADAYTAMLVRSYTEDVVSGHPDLDLVILDSDEPGLQALWRQVARLRSYQFDVVLVLHPTFRLALLTRMAGIPNRVGTAYRAYSFLFNHKIPQHRKNSGKHELDLNLEMAAAIGAMLEQVEFKFHIPQQAGERVAAFLRKNGIDEKGSFVVLHPGSGGSALDWPAEQFGRLARSILDEIHVPVIVTGTRAESDLLDRLETEAKGGVIRAESISNIKELAALLKKASLFVGNSTGPLHIAVAVGTEVIGLYCPIMPCRPERWGPYHRLDSVIIPPVEACDKCRPDRCKYENCMELISVDQVMALAIKKLNMTQS